MTGAVGWSVEAFGRRSLPPVTAIISVGQAVEQELADLGRAGLWERELSK